MPGTIAGWLFSRSVFGGELGRARDPDYRDPDGRDPDGHDPDGRDPDGHHPSAGAAHWCGDGRALRLLIDRQIHRLEPGRMGEPGDATAFGDGAAVDLLDVAGEIDR